MSKARSRGDDPVAWISNGDPPPESVFESCAFGADVAAAPFVDEDAVLVGGATTVVVVSVPVAFGSSVKAPVDELELVSCAVLDSSPSPVSVEELTAVVDVTSAVVELSFFVVAAAVLLVFTTSVVSLATLELLLVTSAVLGHRILIPTPF